MNVFIFSRVLCYWHCVLFGAWSLSFSIIILRSTQAIAWISSSFNYQLMIYWMDIPECIYPHICWWIFELFPVWSYCRWSCSMCVFMSLCAVLCGSKCCLPYGDLWVKKNGHKGKEEGWEQIHALGGFPKSWKWFQITREGLCSHSYSPQRYSGLSFLVWIWGC